MSSSISPSYPRMGGGEMDVHPDDGTVLSEISLLIRRYPVLESCRTAVIQAYHILKEALEAGSKVLLCGNGGSAADAEHISGELMKGFLLPRKLRDEWRSKLRRELPAEDWYERLQMALPAIALTSNTVLASAIANDQGADLVFAQQVLGYGRPGDVLMVISTSGNSDNVIKAAQTARFLGLKVIGLTGAAGGKLKEFCDVAITVPATVTAEIQELHLPVYHCICAMLEANFFKGR